MNHPDRLQEKIDTYLMQLRRGLGELPPEEVAEILQEIRGHILERVEAGGELSEERLLAVLRALGRPEEIAPLYQAGSLVARARRSFSPWLVLRGALRWAMLSVWGLVLFVVGLIGYGFASAFILSGLGKIIVPHQIGFWISPGGFNIGTNSDPGAQEMLGWWLIPVGLVVGSVAIIATTRLLRWALRFARIRRPTEGPRHPAVSPERVLSEE